MTHFLLKIYRSGSKVNAMSEMLALLLLLEMSLSAEYAAH